MHVPCLISVALSGGVGKGLVTSGISVKMVGLKNQIYEK
jgi:hypothetical protein